MTDRISSFEKHVAAHRDRVERKLALQSKSAADLFKALCSLEDNHEQVIILDSYERGIIYKDNRFQTEDGICVGRDAQSVVNFYRYELNMPDDVEIKIKALNSL